MDWGQIHGMTHGGHLGQAGPSREQWDQGPSTPPIAIPSTSPSTSVSTSPGSFVSASKARDGPLLVRPSSSSARYVGLQSVSAVDNHSLARHASQKRYVSTPMSFSPRSPLAVSADSFSASSSRHNQGEARKRLSGHLLTPHQQQASPGSLASSASPGTKQRRRRSSAGSLATPYGSFVGSYENSLLSGRMSALPSRPFKFASSLGVLGSEDTPQKLRCPKHLNLDFDAMFYEGQEGPTSCPYVGTIDLEAYYMGMMSQPDMTQARAPKFPGYRVPVKGQIQLVLRNPNSTAIKLFLIPYDLNGLNRRGEGGKTFLQQKSYSVSNSDKHDERGKLRFAVHLKFCSPPLAAAKPNPTSSTQQQPQPHYYLHQTIRVVFASRALDVEDKLRVVNDSPATSHDQAADRFSAYYGPPVEFEILRKKLRERERVRRVLEAEAAAAAAAPAPSHVVHELAPECSAQHSPHDPNLLPESYEPVEFDRPLLSTPPASDLEGPMSLSSIGSALPASSPSATTSFTSPRRHSPTLENGPPFASDKRGRPSLATTERRPSNLALSFATLNAAAAAVHGSAGDTAFSSGTSTALPSPTLTFEKQARRESTTRRSALSQSRPGSRNE